MPLNKTCQSCSMPLKRDPAGGGTEADGSKSTLYCSLCYKDGHFLQLDVTCAEMQAFVKGKLIEMGFPRILIYFYVKGIQRLQRWRH